MRLGQMLPQLPEQLLYWWSPSDNLPVTARLRAEVVFSYSLQGPRWSLIDLVSSFVCYSPYHSTGCTHSSPSAASSLNYQSCLLSLQTWIKHKRRQSHCTIPKKILLFSNLSSVRSNTFGGSLLHRCATVLQPLPTEEIRWLRQPSLPIRLRFRPTRRPDVLSYCFMQNT